MLHFLILRAGGCCDPAIVFSHSRCLLGLRFCHCFDTISVTFHEVTAAVLFSSLSISYFSGCTEPYVLHVPLHCLHVLPWRDVTSSVLLGVPLKVDFNFLRRCVQRPPPPAAMMLWMFCSKNKIYIRCCNIDAYIRCCYFQSCTICYSICAYIKC